MRGAAMKGFYTILAFVLFCLSSVPAAQGKSITYYTDGALVELEARAVKGILEVPLLPGLLDRTLRVKPIRGATIVSVDILRIESGNSKTEKELEALIEQKNRLGDRLQALTVREEIFTAAAKSQSGKAPRRTKTNPDPMQSIRQGTEFAIAQLEAVYTARRKTELDIKRLDSKIASARKNHRGTGPTARIAVSPATGTAVIRYAIAAQPWTPHYDIHLNGDSHARIVLSGQFPTDYPGYRIQVSPGSVADSTAAKTVTTLPGSRAAVGNYLLGANNVIFGTGLLTTYSFDLFNREKDHLPAGEANIYHKGEFFGTVRFEGISSGRSRKVSLGI